MSFHEKNRRFLATAIGCGMIGLGPSTAYSSVSGLEEVIVTAQKQEENMQVVPIAISALTAEDIQNQGITSFEGVAKASPSINILPAVNSSNTLIVYMRGQGVINPGEVTQDGGVGLYIDGFYLARPQASTFDMADVERVEVLRGPQGTLYGRNTTGGAVNIISKQPTGEFGFRQELDFGTRNLFRSLTAINLPKIGEVSTKITLLKSSRNGYVKNAGSGHDYGEEAQLGGRFQLHWDVAQDIAVDYFLEKGNLDSTPVYFQRPEFNGALLFNSTTPYYAAHGPMRRTYRPIDLQLSTSSFEGHGLTLSWDVSDQLTLKSLTGYRELDSQGYQDYAETLGVPYSGTDLFHQHQFSEEVQFIGNFLDNRFNYVAGLYYFEEGVTHDAANDILLAPGLFYDQSQRVNSQAKSEAIFAQLTWTPDILEDRLDFTLGARYTRDKKEAERFSGDNFSGVLEEGKATPGASNDLSFSRFTPTFTVNYRWTNDISSYAKVSTGYKAGGSEDLSPIGNFDQTFGPEKLTNYELGVKSYWFDHHVRLNVAAYDSKYEDIQILLRTDPTAFNYQAYNAGRATIKGIEAELLVAPIDDLIINLGYNYLHGTMDVVDVLPNTIFDPATNPASPYHYGDNVKDLFAVLYSPRNSFNVGVDYSPMHFDGGSVSTHLDYRWQESYANAGSGTPGKENTGIPSFGLLNGRLTLNLDLPRGDKAKISIWGKNLANKKYYQNISPNGAFVPLQAPGSTTVTPAGFSAPTIAWSEPPSYGVQLVYEY